VFQTKVKLSKSPDPITLDDRILTLGSCFAVNIGSKLEDNKFKASTNPFGTLFNPVSTFKLVNQAALKDIIESMGIVESQGVFHHYDLHSGQSNTSKQELLERANKQMKNLSEQLSDTSVLIYTFGTAIVYELLETGEIVANCHKVPAGEFNRRFLDIDEIVHSFKVNHDLIKSINKSARFILSVSPVRHQKESFEQNNVSKSILRIAIEKIIGDFSSAEYFPAFEIMMDELRDYRFYAEDMLHPNQVAIDHIWGRFMEVYFDNETKEFIQKWSKIRKALSHKPFNPESKEHQKFLIKTIDQLHEFSDRINIENELKLLKSQLL
jgi:hypothetical protein